MDVKIILSTQIISLLIKTSSSQYYGNQYQQPYQQAYPQYQQPSYQQPSYPQQLFPQLPPSMQAPIQVHMPQSQPQASTPTRQDNRPNLRTRYDDYSTDYDYRDDVSDSERENLRQRSQSLREEISKPVVPTDILSRPAVQPNLVLVPYPYALIVPTSTPGTTTPTPKNPPEIAAIPDTPKEGSDSDTVKECQLRRIHHTVHEPDIRYRPRKTKPTWLPKYGIVPIPDKLAEKLMSQLRQVKGLQARRNDKIENKNGYSSAIQYKSNL